MAKSKPGKIHAILGRSRRTGRWRLGPKTSIVAVFGSCRLDLRHASIDTDTSKMTATVFLGAVTVVVPPGVEVRPSGLSLLGGASVNVPPFEETEEPPLIELEWTSIFGKLRVGAEVEVEVEVEVESEDGTEAETEAEPEPSETIAATTPAPQPDATSPALGFEDLGEPTLPPVPAVGFEDLDDTPTEAPTDPTPTPTPTPTPAVGFEDL